MAAPTKSEVESMDFSQNGGPWVFVASNSTVDTNTMDYSFDGGPWWGVNDTSGSTSSVGTFNGLSYSSVSVINALSTSSIGTINGLA